MLSAGRALPSPRARGRPRTCPPCGGGPPRQSLRGSRAAGPDASSPCALLGRYWRVGLGGLAPPASSLSVMRSNHLSYRPARLPALSARAVERPVCEPRVTVVGQRDLDAAGE